MALQKVDLGGERKRFKAVELPRFNMVVREPLAEKAEKEIGRCEDFIATGVTKRIDITREERGEESAKILEWLWSRGLSMIQKVVAPGCSTILLHGNPRTFYKFNIGQENQWSIGHGYAFSEPKLKPLMGELRKEIRTPDTFMQWSGDMNYPYNFAHITSGEVLMKACEYAHSRGWFYPLPPNNDLWTSRKGNFRMAGWTGLAGALIPGEQSMDKHKYIHEKEHTCRWVYTPKEAKYHKEIGYDKVQYSAGEHVGLDMDQFYEDLVNGKHDDELLKPGVKADFSAAIPYQRTLRRSISFWRGKKSLGEPGWWKEKDRLNDDGVMVGFGEFEEEEFRERLKLLGYREVDEEALFKAKVPDSLSRECKIPEALVA